MLRAAGVRFVKQAAARVFVQNSLSPIRTVSPGSTGVAMVNG
jgi:hypothetical protein